MSTIANVLESRRGRDGLELLMPEGVFPFVDPSANDFEQVIAVFFDEEEFTSGSMPGQLHPSKDNSLDTLKTLSRVPILNHFVTEGHVQYEQVPVDVCSLMREGVCETGDGDPVDKLLNGLRETGVDVVAPGAQVMISPRFIACAVIALRSTLGRIEPTSANQIVVAREYNRLCRKRNVRAVVQEQNRTLVYECFFKEDVLDRLTTRYSRLPRWLEWFVWWSRTDEPALARFV